MATYTPSDLYDRLQQASEALGGLYPRGVVDIQNPAAKAMWMQQLLIEELIRRERARTVEAPSL